MILADTSAWIELLRATGSAVDRRLTSAIEADELLATTGPVVLELLAGGRDERHAQDLRRLLDRCEHIAVDDPTDFEAASSLYRACRRAGVTIRRLPDCVIAVVAMRAGVPILHRDADFDHIARIAPLEIAELDPA